MARWYILYRSAESKMMDFAIQVKTKKLKYFHNFKFRIGVLLPFGLFLLLIGMFCETIFNSILKQKLILRPGTEVYEAWRSPPLPVYVKYYIFNYTNVDDILQNGAKPHVAQLGPFTYREVRVNQVVDYNEWNITYVQDYTYIFQPDLSCSSCSEDIPVYVPNIALMSVLKDIHEKVKAPSYWTKLAINAALKSIEGTSTFKRLKVGELIWGYEDDILKFMGSLEGILKLFGVKLPGITKISLGKNGTEYTNDVGNLTILTGKKNINDVQKIIKWKDNAGTLPFWNTKYGNMINGSEGAQSHPFVGRSDRLYAFAPQLCRSFYFTYVEDVTFHGVPLLRFKPPSGINSDNITVSPNSVEFCNETDVCIDGLLSVGRCQFGNPPIFMSSPHFYLADPKIQGRIDGLKPNKELHGSFIDVEPTIGATMRGYKRMQVNFMVRKSFVHITNIFQHDINFLPICYVEQVGNIDAHFGEKFRNMVLIPKAIMKYGGITLMAVGSVILLLISFLILSSLYRRRTKEKENKTKSPESDEKVMKELLPSTNVTKI